MTSIIRFRNLGLAVAAAAALLAGCAAESPPAPVALAPPPVALPAKVVEAATAYQAYVEQASSITGVFADGAEVSAKLKQAAAYNADQFQRGEIAYAAIVALQDPAFVAGVREYTRTAATRSEMANNLIQNPNYAIGLKGADSAAGLVIAALDSQGIQLRSAGEKVRQAAYDVQREAWSKKTVPDRDQRLAAVKAISATLAAATLEQNGRLRLASTGEQPLIVSGTPVSPPYTPAVVRGLAVAALAVLGEATEANTDIVWAVLQEPNQQLCLNLAKMNLNQCLAVAKPHYEDVFCLGVHIMMDTGSCIVKGAGAPKTTPAMIAAAGPATADPAISSIPAAKP